MRYEIHKHDWPAKLADTVGLATDGDTIVCYSQAMIELGERARVRMCPRKVLVFELETS